jgi:hypothetical protein
MFKKRTAGPVTKRHSGNLPRCFLWNIPAFQGIFWLKADDASGAAPHIRRKQASRRSSRSECGPHRGEFRMNRLTSSFGGIVFVAAFACSMAANAADKTSPLGANIKMAAAGSIETAASEAATAEAQTASVPNCARKVKVVYSGYGEADRANCAAPSAAAVH